MNLIHTKGFPGGSHSKESTCNAGDLGLIPGLGRSPGGWHGNSLQYSCLENPHGQEEPGGLQSTGSQRVRHDWVTKHSTQHTGRTTRPFKYDLNQILYDCLVEEMNQFKGLGLGERTPEELWIEVRNIVYEVVTNTIIKRINARRQSGCLRRPYK